MPFIYNGSKDTPEIILDKEKNVYKITGNSFQDDPYIVYKFVHEWLDGFVKDPSSSMNFEIKLNYVNTASSKQIADILIRLEELSGICEVKVLWYYDDEDDGMLDEGETLSDMINVEFEFVEY